jgi:hypothetical protein
VVWTGSTFVAGWGECTRDNYYAHCLGVWTPLTDTGAAAGPLRITGYATLYNYDTADFRLGLTALDRDSVLFTWLGADDNTVLGREYLVTGAAAGPTADFGKGPITTLMTRDGALAVMDERQRLAWVDNAVGAGLPDTLEFAPTVLAPPNEVIYGVAESETEIAVLRANGAGSSPSVGVSVLSRDGSLLRELDLGVELVGNGAIASDGRDFFAVTYHWWSGLTFHNLTTKKSTTLTSTGAYPSMVWTGRELIVVSLRESKVVVMRLDRDGRQLGTPSTLTPAHALIDLAIHNGRVLVTYHAERTTYVQVLDEHGQLVGPPEEVLDTNPWWYGAAATNGDTDVLVTMKADLSDMLVSFRPRNGTFVTPPGRVTAARSRTANYATIVPTTHGFLLAYQTSAPVLRSTNLALIDSQGFPVRELKVHIGSVGRNMLVPISPTELLLVYSRVVDDSSRAGAWRGYVRRITLVHEDGARNEPSSNRLRR